MFRGQVLGKQIFIKTSHLKKHKKKQNFKKL